MSEFATHLQRDKDETLHPKRQPKCLIWFSEGNDQSIYILRTSCFILTPIYVGFGPLANLHTDIRT